MANNLASEEEKKHLTEVFKKLDKNGNGYLSKEELKAGYTKRYGITEEELDDMMKKVDFNENGEINFKGIFFLYIKILNKYN